MPPDADVRFGIAPGIHAKLLRLFDRTPGLVRVWIYGSRARGDARHESDIDLAIDWPDAGNAFLQLKDQIDESGLIYRTDVLRWQDTLADDFRLRID